MGGSSDETAKTEGFRVTAGAGAITLRRAHFLFKFIYSLQKMRLGSKVSSSKFYGRRARPHDLKLRRYLSLNLNFKYLKFNMTQSFNDLKIRTIRRLGLIVDIFVD